TARHAVHGVAGEARGRARVRATTRGAEPRRRAGDAGAVPGGLAGGRHPAREALQRRAGHGAVRRRAEALPGASRGAVMTVSPGTRVDADADLVEALRREDPDAAEHLVERFGDRVYRLAMRIT